MRLKSVQKYIYLPHSWINNKITKCLAMIINHRILPLLNFSEIKNIMYIYTF